MDYGNPFSSRGHYSLRYCLFNTLLDIFKPFENDDRKSHMQMSYTTYERPSKMHTAILTTLLLSLAAWLNEVFFLHLSIQRV